MLNVTKKTLIYYENEGLVKPTRDNNNYRIIVKKTFQELSLYFY